jgi:hypothetical protein
MHILKKVVPPFDQVQGVHIKDVLFAFIDFSLYPVAIQVPEKVVDILGSGCVPNPLAHIKSKKGFLGVTC